MANVTTEELINYAISANQGVSYLEDTNERFGRWMAWALAEQSQEDAHALLAGITHDICAKPNWFVGMTKFPYDLGSGVVIKLDSFLILIRRYYQYLEPINTIPFATWAIANLEMIIGGIDTELIKL